MMQYSLELVLVSSLVPRLPLKGESGFKVSYIMLHGMQLMSNLGQSQILYWEGVQIREVAFFPFLFLQRRESGNQTIASRIILQCTLFVKLM